MGTPKIKATYSLDIETVQELERLAKRLRISKSAALRRAIHLAAEQECPDKDIRLEALDSLQRSLGRQGVDLERWAQDFDRRRNQGYRAES